jgi:molecular chaperone DnaJ
MINTEVECTTCFGTGTIPKEKCLTCKGKGTTHGRDDITFKVPASIQNGSVMTMQGRGEAIMGGVPGDLYIRIDVDEDKIWKRHGLDLVRVLEIKLTDALLGAKISADTLNGKETVTIESGTQHSDVIIEKGRGFVSGNRKGNIQYVIKINIPKKVNSKSREYIEKLKEEGI